ncbi:MAG: ribosome silencing factor [Candidatus Omnitrophica bacterium]|nr:ribosome silencing factor [Candidatus Omnitrophota bacterium]
MKTSSSSRNISKLIAKFAAEKKAEEIVALDMRGLVNFCDYFVICSGNTDRHVKAIADYIDEELAKLGQKARYRQGLNKADWIVLDNGDVVTHIFQKKLREFYNLEYLWQEAKPVKWE